MPAIDPGQGAPFVLVGKVGRLDHVAKFLSFLRAFDNSVPEKVELVAPTCVSHQVEKRLSLKQDEHETRMQDMHKGINRVLNEKRINSVIRFGRQNKSGSPLFKGAVVKTGLTTAIPVSSDSLERNLDFDMNRIIWSTQH